MRVGDQRTKDAGYAGVQAKLAVKNLLGEKTQEAAQAQGELMIVDGLRLLVEAAYEGLDGDGEKSMDAGSPCWLPQALCMTVVSQ